MSDSKPDPVPAAEPAPTAVATSSEPVATTGSAVVPATSTDAPVEKPVASTTAPVTSEPATAPAAADAVKAEDSKEDATKEGSTTAAPANAAPVVVPVLAKEEPAKEADTKPTEAKPATGAEPSAPTEKKPLQDLWAVAKEHAHKEVWGVTLADPESHIPSQIVLQKYLNANDGDFTKAKDQLVKTLDWRAKTNPLELIKKSYNKAKFGGLGYVTTYAAAGDEAKGPESKEVFTWNIYGGAKSIEETFGALQEFIDWRVALMELALQELSIATATVPITATNDPYKIFQVHDYKSISFLRQPASVRSASSETIKVMAQNYPELLKEKFFVNVPAVMGFMYGLMKLFVAPKTLKKFHPMSNGTALAAEFKNSKVAALGEQLPTEYGGKGADLVSTGKQTSLEE